MVTPDRTACIVGNLVSCMTDSICRLALDHEHMIHFASIIIAMHLYSRTHQYPAYQPVKHSNILLMQPRLPFILPLILSILAGLGFCRGFCRGLSKSLMRARLTKSIAAASLELSYLGTELVPADQARYCRMDEEDGQSKEKGELYSRENVLGFAEHRCILCLWLCWLNMLGLTLTICVK